MSSPEKPIATASSRGVSSSCSSQGLRQATGSDDPAMNGAPSARARSYIHLASGQLYDRCLSLNTGTLRPLVANTPQICSMK